MRPLGLLIVSAACAGIAAGDVSSAPDRAQANPPSRTVLVNTKAVDGVALGAPLQAAVRRWGRPSTMPGQRVWRGSGAPAYPWAIVKTFGGRISVVAYFAKFRSAKGDTIGTPLTTLKKRWGGFLARTGVAARCEQHYVIQLGRTYAAGLLVFVIQRGRVKGVFLTSDVAAAEAELLEECIAD